jgi:hypothetical protein
MPSLDTFSNTSAKSGQINKQGVVYVVDTATGTPKVSYNTATTEEDRSFFSFDTSSIPDDALITAVDFYWSINAAAGGGPGIPSTWVTRFAIGTFIGAALDSSDWSGGTWVDQYTGTPVSQWIDMLVGGPSYVNLSGDTDIRVYDSSLMFGAGAWNHTIKKSNTVLRVTYQLARMFNCRIFNCKIVNA